MTALLALLLLAAAATGSLNPLLTVAAAWAGLILAVMWALNAYRSSLERGHSPAWRPLTRAAGTGAKSPEDAGRMLPGRSRLPWGQTETVIARIQKGRVIRVHKHKEQPHVR